jgi:hypothetical protein
MTNISSFIKGNTVSHLFRYISHTSRLKNYVKIRYLNSSNFGLGEAFCDFDCVDS